MARVVDTRGLFAALNDHNFNGQSVRLRLSIEDDFLPENAGDTVLHVTEGHAEVVPGGAADVTLRLHVRDFSSLIVGAVSLAWLTRNGLATLDKPELLPLLDRLFAWPQKPICFTRF
ncbi:MAG: sterol carrier protein domain-containing protein [Caldilineaceae bacterium]